MDEKCICVSRAEVPWVTWQRICVKFGFDPFKTGDVLLYCTKAIPNTVEMLLKEVAE